MKAKEKRKMSHMHILVLLMDVPDVECIKPNFSICPNFDFPKYKLILDNLLCVVSHIYFK